MMFPQCLQKIVDGKRLASPDAGGVVIMKEQAMEVEVTSFLQDAIVALIELKKTMREDTKGMEQLCRSIPVLDYLHSVCHIDSRSGRGARKSYPAVQNVLIGEREAARLDKQSVRPNTEFKKVPHHGIDVNLSLKCQINFDELVELHHG